VGQSVRLEASQSSVTMNPVLCSSKSDVYLHPKMQKEKKENPGL
jgi:hypothetical protein